MLYLHSFRARRNLWKWGVWKDASSYGQDDILFILFLSNAFIVPILFVEQLQQGWRSLLIALEFRVFFLFFIIFQHYPIIVFVRLSWTAYSLSLSLNDMHWYAISQNLYHSSLMDSWYSQFKPAKTPKRKLHGLHQVFGGAPEPRPLGLSPDAWQPGVPVAWDSSVWGKISIPGIESIEHSSGNRSIFVNVWVSEFRACQTYWSVSEASICFVQRFSLKSEISNRNCYSWWD